MNQTLDNVAYGMAAVLTYQRKTKLEFSIIEEAKLLFEDTILRKYPELTMQVERCLLRSDRGGAKPRLRAGGSFWR